MVGGMAKQLFTCKYNQLSDALKIDHLSLTAFGQRTR